MARSTVPLATPNFFISAAALGKGLETSKPPLRMVDFNDSIMSMALFPLTVLLQTPPIVANIFKTKPLA
jgi:hypothetical protein